MALPHDELLSALSALYHTVIGLPDAVEAGSESQLSVEATRTEEGLKVPMTWLNCPRYLCAYFERLHEIKRCANT